MDLKDKSTSAWMAREVAALAAEGEDTAHIWMKLDLSASEVEEIYTLPEFEAAMRTHGEDLWKAWSLSRAEDRSRHSAHQYILARTSKYLEALDRIAMNDETKDETRARILLSFLESTKQLGPDLDVGQRISLSPAALELINRGDAVYRKHPPPVIDPCI